jgi:hypothetical protein
VLHHLPEPCDGARLNAFGRREELAPLAELYNIPFEPVIIERVLAERSIVWIWVLGGIVAVIIQLILGHVAQVGWTNFGPALYPIGMLIVWLIQRLRPTYYRIVPGRMDVLRFSLLTNRARIAERYDLRTSRITARFDRGQIEFDADGEQTRTLKLFGLSRPYSFVAALFQGAISTHTAPPLPDDSLLG